MRYKKDQIKNKREFLWKQMEELFKLRERNIETMGGVHKAYLTFLPILGATISLILTIDKMIVFTKVFWITMILLGFATFFYGLSIFNKEILTHINQVIYTKKINMTRRCLIETEDFKKIRLLPTYAKRPAFGTTTYLEKDLSTVGIIHFLKWVDSIVIFLTFIALFWTITYWGNLFSYKEILNNSTNNEYPTLIFNCYLIICLIISFGIGLVSFHAIHMRKFKSLNIEARNKWNNELGTFFIHANDDFDFDENKQIKEKNIKVRQNRHLY